MIEAAHHACFRVTRDQADVKGSKRVLKLGPLDVHAHYLPPELLTLCDAGALGPRVTLENGGRTVNINGYLMPRDQERGSEASEVRVSDMDKAGVAVQLLSPNPIFFHYWDEPARALYVCQTMNDGVARAVARHPDRFLGLAIIPLQAPELALTELRRATNDLGLIGVEIGSHINGKDLDDPALEPFFSEVTKLGIPVQVHPCPHDIAGRERLDRYHLRNLIGNLVETSIAVASMIFGGVLARHPSLRIGFAHGGGLVPYQIGRWDHGHSVRPEARIHLDNPPTEYFEKCWFDTILHSDAALNYLVSASGSKRILMGTDYPADMSDPGAVERIRRVVPDPIVVEAILYRNAYAWLGLDAPHEPQANTGV